MQPSRSSRFAALVVLVIASAAGVAIAAERAAETTRPDAAAPKPGPDGWYDARPIDDSFSVRLPGVFHAFRDEGKTETGVATESIGVRADVTTAFGGVTTYAASCTTQKGDARPPEERLQAVVDYWESQGTMGFRRPIESGPVPGFEFEIGDDKKVIRSRIYAPKSRTCTVLMWWPRYAKPSDADIGKYLDSFQFTKR
jgi:hypothetical protein